MNVSKAQADAPETIGVPVPPSVELHDMTPALAEKVSVSDRRVADVIKLGDARK
jgi:hypothetical protein